VNTHNAYTALNGGALRANTIFNNTVATSDCALLRLASLKSGKKSFGWINDYDHIRTFLSTQIGNVNTDNSAAKQINGSDNKVIATSINFTISKIKAAGTLAPGIGNLAGVQDLLKAKSGDTKGDVFEPFNTKDNEYSGDYAITKAITLNVVTAGVPHAVTYNVWNVATDHTGSQAMLDHLTNAKLGKGINTASAYTKVNEDMGNDVTNLALTQLITLKVTHANAAYNINTAV